MMRGPISAFWPLAAFFVFSSFAFGCMEGWSIATCEVILFLGAGLVGLSGGRFWTLPVRLWLPALLVVVLILVGLLQLVPIPVSIWRAVSPDRVSRFEEGAKAEALLHSEDYRRNPFASPEAAPLAEEKWVHLTPPRPSWLPASFTPGQTLKALLALGAGLCLILLLERAAEEGGEVLRRLAGLAGVLGLLVAASGIAVRGGAGEAVLGLRASEWASTSFGPFVNPNHGMAFVNLTFPLLYYLCWRSSIRARSRGERWGMRVLVIALLIVHASAALVSHTRAAFLALALLPLAWLLHLSGNGNSARESSRTGEHSNGSHGTRRERRWFRWAAAGFAALFLAGVGWTWAMGLFADHGRMELWSGVPLGHFVLGSGLGSFQARFPAVWTDMCVYCPVYNTHMENEYLQLLFEAGVAPALIAVVAGVVALAVAFRATLVRSPIFWLAPGLAGETIHASVDFTAHVFPIVGLYLLVYIMAVTGIEKERAGSKRPVRGGDKIHTPLQPEAVPSLP